MRKATGDIVANGLLQGAEVESKRLRKGFFFEMRRHGALYSMFLPGAIFLLVFAYLPMVGLVIPFKYITYSNSFWSTLFDSKWVGFYNFQFFWDSPDLYRIMRNTIGYNVINIVLGLVIAVSVAIALNEIRNRKSAKTYQTIMFMPYFLSWVIVGYLAYAFLSPNGFINMGILKPFGIEQISFYTDPKYWPFILIFFAHWKGTGYGVIIYLAAIAGQDQSLYEAAAIDGASRGQQIRKIMIPLLKPMMIILTILAVGGIFSSDFGLFYNVPLNQGVLKETTDVINTYVYNALMSSGDISLSAAVGLFQSVLGFFMVVGVNWIAGKIDPESKLF
ncbi:ABC transporter permease [Paenibacillus sp. JDR-2]|uniref:ABC transporter permease n=1 Tax=Paenibacillus sp. (strain JDR-2) TaxID=324057 RepID=UPI0001666C00|nr:binding-protein-dependent transport systems inner membrane component [Paenibacillus sp. JDR-2]